MIDLTFIDGTAFRWSMLCEQVKAVARVSTGLSGKYPKSRSEFVGSGFSSAKKRYARPHATIGIGNQADGAAFAQFNQLDISPPQSNAAAFIRARPADPNFRWLLNNLAKQREVTVRRKLRQATVHAKQPGPDSRKVDLIVVYKVDRLTRSIICFSLLV